jgi:hypothetical protein
VRVRVTGLGNFLFFRHVLIGLVWLFQ